MILTFCSLAAFSVNTCSSILSRSFSLINIVSSLLYAALTLLWAT